MPLPTSGPARHVSVARHPIRTQPRRNSSSAGPWFGLILLAVAGSAASGLWFMKTRAALPPPAPEAANVPTPPAVVEPAAATPSAVSEEMVRQAVAEAPLLAPEAARALLVETVRRGRLADDALGVALFVAGIGFQDLDRATLAELSELFSRCWNSRSAADQKRIQAYMRYARAGEALSPEAIAAGRALFVESIRVLPAESQRRLTSLFTRAVTTGIAHQLQAEERARLAALSPFPAAETQTPTPGSDTSGPATAYRRRGSAAAAIGPAAVVDGSSGEPRGADADEPSRDASAGRGESYWRSRAQGARSAVAAAEKRVRELEEKAARGGPLVPGPFPEACQAVAPSRGRHPAGTVLGPRSGNAPRCAVRL